MRLREGVIINEMDGEVIVVDATSDPDKRFNGMLRMNKTAGFIAGLLEKDTDLDAIVLAMTAKYNVTEADARRNAQKVIETFENIGLLV